MQYHRMTPNTYRNYQNDARKLPGILFVIMCLCLTACQSFEPYDYEKAKDAQFHLEKFGCSVGIHGKKLYLKKKLGVPKLSNTKQH